MTSSRAQKSRSGGPAGGKPVEGRQRRCGWLCGLPRGQTDGQKRPSEQRYERNVSKGVNEQTSGRLYGQIRTAW